MTPIIEYRTPREYHLWLAGLLTGTDLTQSLAKEALNGLSSVRLEMQSARDSAQLSALTDELCPLAAGAIIPEVRTGFRELSSRVRVLVCTWIAEDNEAVCKLWARMGGPVTDALEARRRLGVLAAAEVMARPGDDFVVEVARLVAVGQMDRSDE